jgi:hypothetical protein
MKSRIILVSAFGLALGGCSGLPSFSSLPGLSFLKSAPTIEQLQIESAPAGAEARGSDGTTCQTPCQLVATSGNVFLVTVSKSGYQPLIVEVHPDGPGGQLEPNPVLAELQSVVSPLRAKKSPPPKKKSKPATENQ